VPSFTHTHGAAGVSLMSPLKKGKKEKKEKKDRNKDSYPE
jgi:hypothetical protein